MRFQVLTVKGLCPFGYELYRIPEPDCSPKSKMNMYVGCDGCKTFQQKHPELRLEQLSKRYVKEYGAEAELRGLDRFVS